MVDLSAPEQIMDQINPVIPFFELTPDQTRIFQEKVRQHNGKLRLFVHPLFMKYHPEFPLYGDGKNEETLSRGFAALLRKTNVSPPMIVLEEEQFLPRTVEYIKTVVGPQSRLYSVPTETGNPDPIIAEREIGSPVAPSKNWDVFADRLSSLGVKDILIGGSNLYLLPTSAPLVDAFYEQRKEQGEKNLQYSILGCVGTTIRELTNRNFHVDLSEFASPHNRTSLQNLEAAKGNP